MSKKTRLLKILSASAGITAITATGAATVLTATSCSKSTGQAGISVYNNNGSITMGAGGAAPTGTIQYFYKGINVSTSDIAVTCSPNDVTVTNQSGVVTIEGKSSLSAIDHTVTFSSPNTDPVVQHFTPIASNSVTASPYFIYSAEAGSYLKSGNITNVYQIKLQGLNGFDWTTVNYSVNDASINVDDSEAPVTTGSTSTKTYKLTCANTSVTAGSKTITFTTNQAGVTNTTLRVNFTVNPKDAEQSYMLSIFNAENQLQVDNVTSTQILCIKPINNFDLTQQITWTQQYTGNLTFTELNWSSVSSLSGADAANKYYSVGCSGRNTGNQTVTCTIGTYSQTLTLFVAQAADVPTITIQNLSNNLQATNMNSFAEVCITLQGGMESSFSPSTATLSLKANDDSTFLAYKDNDSKASNVALGSNYVTVASSFYTYNSIDHTIVFYVSLANASVEAGTKTLSVNLVNGSKNCSTQGNISVASATAVAINATVGYNNLKIGDETSFATLTINIFNKPNNNWVNTLNVNWGTSGLKASGVWNANEDFTSASLKVVLDPENSGYGIAGQQQIQISCTPSSQSLGLTAGLAVLPQDPIKAISAKISNNNLQIDTDGTATLQITSYNGVTLKNSTNVLFSVEFYHNDEQTTNIEVVGGSNNVNAYEAVGPSDNVNSVLQATIRLKTGIEFNDLNGYYVRISMTVESTVSPAQANIAIAPAEAVRVIKTSLEKNLLQKGDSGSEAIIKVEGENYPTFFRTADSSNSYNPFVVHPVNAIWTPCSATPYLGYYTDGNFKYTNSTPNGVTNYTLWTVRPQDSTAANNLIVGLSSISFESDQANVENASASIEIKAPGVLPTLQLFAYGNIDLSTADNVATDYIDVDIAAFNGAEKNQISGLKIYSDSTYSTEVTSWFNIENVGDDTNPKWRITNPSVISGNSTPDVDTTHWSITPVSYTEKGTWDQFSAYSVGDRVVYNGTYYYCISAVTANNGNQHVHAPSGTYYIKGISNFANFNNTQFTIGNSLNNTVSYTETDTVSTRNLTMAIPSNILATGSVNVATLLLSQVTDPYTVINNIVINSDQITSLTFGENRFNTITKIDFSNCPNLQAVDVENCAISEISIRNNLKLESLAFHKCSSLSTLNGIEAAPNLMELSFIESGISNLVLTNSNVQYLTINNCYNLSNLSLPTGLLEATFAANNSFSLPTTLADAPNLKKIMIMNANFTDPNIVNFASTLEQINVTHTNITSIILETNTALLTNALLNENQIWLDFTDNPYLSVIRLPRFSTSSNTFTWHMCVSDGHTYDYVTGMVPTIYARSGDTIDEFNDYSTQNQAEALAHISEFWWNRINYV